MSPSVTSSASLRNCTYCRYTVQSYTVHNLRTSRLLIAKMTSKIDYLRITIMFLFLIRGGHKRRPQSGGRGLSSADILQTRGEGFFQIQTSALFAQKPSFFSEFMVCPRYKEGGEPVRTFFG